jgi:hypothetical protein
MSKPLLMFLLFAGLLAGAFLQHRWIKEMRAENEALSAATRQTESAERALELENLQKQKDTLAEVVTNTDQIRQENQELLKLRSEVGQLRGKKREYDRVRSEVERLAKTQNQTPTSTSPRPFTRADQYVFADFVSPEQTVQNILWAHRQKDTAAMLKCLPPDVVKGWTDDPKGLQERFSEYFERFSEGYQIVATKTVSPDEQFVRVRAPSGAELGIPVKNIAGQWKLKDLHGF